MKNCNIYKFLFNKRKEGDHSFFSAGEIAKAIDHNNGGHLFRKMNCLAVKYDLLEVKIDKTRLCRIYRIKESELKGANNTPLHRRERK